MNALIPQLVWLLDPYNWVKRYKKWQVEKNIKYTTQAELNQLKKLIICLFCFSAYEFTDYLVAKRYADNMKTMWFTFFYCPVIPMGIVVSLLGMTFYYWIDKYNILRRRTVKDSIDKSLTVEMIEMLEWILPLFAVPPPFYCIIILFLFLVWKFIF